MAVPGHAGDIRHVHAVRHVPAHGGHDLDHVASGARRGEQREARAMRADNRVGRINPRAATQIVMEQFPGLSSQMTPAVATESMMQLANVYSGRWGERGKWGYHIIPSWQMFFDVSAEIGQISAPIKAEDVVKNDWVDGANMFDANKVKTDADGFALSDDYKAVDVAAIEAAEGRGSVNPCAARRGTG